MNLKVGDEVVVRNMISAHRDVVTEISNNNIKVGDRLFDQNGEEITTATYGYQIIPMDSMHEFLPKKKDKEIRVK